MIEPMVGLTFALLAAAAAAAAQQPFFDRTHDSGVFGEPRHYRILLPPNYASSDRRYPVIYYFHGHGDRYTVEHYDGGLDTIPRMADYVAGHDLILVCVDGYVAEDYGGFYGGTPWDIGKEGGEHDFGPYFLELVQHIDSTFRTLTDRRHRAVAGLSMGGFLSLYLSARFPDWIGSASAFNPSPEFYTGEKGRRILWRPKDHVASHGQTMVRLVRASGDYISQYHEETREAYARAQGVAFEYRQDEYHRHWATSIAETLDFHRRAFGNPALDDVPESWTYASGYRAFQVRGYRVLVEADGPALTYLEGVRQGGLRVRTRRWAPDGPPAGNATIHVTTAPLYSPGKPYRLLDRNLGTSRTEVREVSAGPDGTLSFSVDGGGHQVSFAGAGTSAEPPLVLPVTAKDALRVPPGKDIPVPIRIYNPRSAPLKDVTAVLSSQYPTVSVLGARAAIPEIPPGGVADVSGKLAVRFTAGEGYFAPARLTLQMTYDGWRETAADIDVLIEPENVPPPAEYVILDGRTVTFPVFRQKGNQGGGESIRRTAREGRGNGNGVLEAGEQATIWVKMPQGMDPFDKGNWYRAKVYTDSPWIEEIGEIEEPKQREWTGALERTSLIRLSEQTPAGVEIPLLLENESWSFRYTPDVRYGPELLYQAFQLHTHHLHRLTLKTGVRDTRKRLSR